MISHMSLCLAQPRSSRKPLIKQSSNEHVLKQRQTLELNLRPQTGGLSQCECLRTKSHWQACLDTPVLRHTVGPVAPQWAARLLVTLLVLEAETVLYVFAFGAVSAVPCLVLVLSFEHRYFSYASPRGEGSAILFSTFPFPTSWSLKHTSLEHRGGSKLRTAILGGTLLFYPLQATRLCWFQQAPVLDSSHTSQFPPGNLLQPSCLFPP